MCCRLLILATIAAGIALIYGVVIPMIRMVWAMQGAGL
jgi:hypothetical protein